MCAAYPGMALGLRRVPAGVMGTIWGPRRGTLEKLMPRECAAEPAGSPGTPGGGIGPMGLRMGVGGEPPPNAGNCSNP